MNVHGPDDGETGVRAPGRTLRSVTSAPKRLVDVVVSGVTLVLTLPIVLLAALAIRLDSAGPVIVRHVRVGRGGAPFDLYRLRSTTDDAEQLTRVGRVLRWSSVDELPQMWNVLRGDMSLVGPRPASPDEAAAEAWVDGVSWLRSVPGLTGTWREADDSRLGRDSEQWSDQSQQPDCGGPDSRAG